ncbi:MAG: HEPN domain-containing protein [Candidatus Nanohaloarchaea archaeon]
MTYAKVLLENEAFADSISRSYYAMSNSAKALLKTEGSSPRTHQGVNSELGKLFRDRIDKKLLIQFSKIQGRREDVDHTNTEVTKKAEEIFR